MTPVWPPRNLPGKADDWGRALELRSDTADSQLLSLRSDVNNSSRYNAGALSVISSGLNEQFERSVISAFPADLSVTGNATIEPFPRATRGINLGIPPNRACQVEVYARHDNVNSGNVRVFAYLSYEDQIISKLTWQPDTEALDGDNSPQKGFGIANEVSGVSGVSTFSLTLIRVGFTSATTTETLTGIEVYATPSQRLT